MNVFELFAKLSLDSSEYDKGLDDASDKASGFGAKLAGGIGGAVKTVAKVGAAAVGAASAAVVGMTKAAVENFAEYEQLVGGVETLFGDSADYVQERASAAFKTAGLSANEYMETVTSFSASLLQSLGGDTEKAAQVADQAIIDMSDNANKMGSSMESIQNAYQGFAKQNYTMLDNLKLGYGGTKEEMQRLLDDAGKLANTKFELSSYADVIEAIHVIQENMGIAGTTAEEAATTISGSLSMVKSSWSNLLTAIGTGDMSMISENIDNLVQSAQTFGQNVIPVVQRSLEGIVQLIGALAPEIASMIPALISDILPSVVDAGIQIVGAFGTALTENINTILFAAGDIIEMLLNAMLNATSGGKSTIMQIIRSIIGVFQENYIQLIDVGIEIISNLIEGISSAIPEILPLIVDVVIDIVNHLIDNADLLLDAGLQLLMGLADGLIQAIPLLISRLPEIIQKIIDFVIGAIPMLINAAMQLILGVVQALPQIIEALVNALPQIIEAVVNGLIEALPLLIEGNIQLIMALVEHLPEIISALIEAIPQIITSIVNVIVSSAPAFLSAVQSIFTMIVNLVQTVGSNLITNVSTWFSNLLNNVESWLKQLPERAGYFAGEMVARFINFIATLPNKAMQVFNNVLNNVKNFGQKLVTEGFQMAKEFGEKLVNKLKEIPSKMLEIGAEIVNGLKNGISNAWSSLTSMAGDLAEGLVKGFKDKLKIGSPSKLFADEIGQWIPAGIAEGIMGNSGVLDDAIKSITSNIVPANTMMGTNIDGLLKSIGSVSENQQINVVVTLEGDADRIFRVVQTKATSNYRLTGNSTLVTV